MKQALSNALRPIVFAAIAFAAGETIAQTTASGPYYALPSWDQTLAPSLRFVVLSNFNNQAVLDRETGLIWERSPSATTHIGVPLPGVFGGDYAGEHCVDLTVGARKGWRLPSVQELLSLVDTTQSGPALPSGHPFTNVQQLDSSFLHQPISYWTSTAYVVTAFGHAFWTVEFVHGSSGVAGAENGVFQFPVWCVRTGSGREIQ